MTVVDSRREALNEIRDRYEQLRAEVQARRRAHSTRGRTAPTWRPPARLDSSLISQPGYVDAFQ